MPFCAVCGRYTENRSLCPCQAPAGTFVDRLTAEQREQAVQRVLELADTTGMSAGEVLVFENAAWVPMVVSSAGSGDQEDTIRSVPLRTLIPVGKACPKTTWEHLLEDALDA